MIILLKNHTGFILVSMQTCWLFVLGSLLTTNIVQFMSTVLKWIITSVDGVGIKHFRSGGF